MGTAKENINKIASEQESSWLNDAKARQINIEMMGVTPQYINKVVKGKENLTLETITKIEQVLGITLIEVPSFETSQVIYIGSTLTKSHISRAFLIPLSEDTQPYSTIGFGLIKIWTECFQLLHLNPTINLENMISQDSVFQFDNSNVLHK